jgi:hypothetical protein
MHRATRRTKPLSFEPLELRLAMAGVVINEFVADNESGILDFSGQRQDWIELKNTGAIVEDISGWFLTDDALNLDKWQLPAGTTLDPGEVLLVFASGKNLVGAELHTNFSLNNGGEYLALIEADGTTLSYDFGPAYPAQLADVSHGTGLTGIATTTQTLVSSTSAVSVLVPTGPDTFRDDNWRELNFTDDTALNGWVSGIGSVGKDINSDSPDFNDPDGMSGSDDWINTDIQAQMSDSLKSAYIRYEFNVNNVEQLTSLELDLRIDDGFIAYLNGTEIARANFGEDFFSTSPSWNSGAGHQQGTNTSISAYNRGAEAADLLHFDLTPYLEFLENGNNVLAFHGVNTSSTSSTIDRRDFLIQPFLTADRATGSSQVGYMAAPSPGRDNGVSTLGFVEDTQFSHDRGFYDTAFNLAITTPTQGATIRYTTDGSAPTLTNGITYAGPIAVDPNTIPNGQRGMVMVRAAAFKAGYTPTNVDTQSYVFLNKVILQDGSGLPAYATWGTDGPDADSASGFQLDADEFDWAMDSDIVGGLHTTQEVIDALKAIPTVSLVTDWANLWSGAAEPGTPPQNWNGNARTAFEPVGIYVHGRSDERPASMEFFTADGTQQFQTDTVIEIQGHSSGGRWASDKLSFQVKFKDPFADSELDFDLFAGTADGENAVTEFDTFVLDAGYNYIWNHNTAAQRNFARFVTDQVAADLQNFASGGGVAPHGKYVHLYLDGVYWGLYNLHERPDEHFGADYFGGDNDDYYVVKHANTDNEHNFTHVNGDYAAEDAFVDLLDATENVRDNPASLAAYQAVADILDVDQFIDYYIVHMYAGNESDWPHNNWYASFDSADPNGLWRFHSWDQEHAFPTTDNGDSWNELSDPTDTGSEDAEGPGDVFHDLIQHAEFRMRFGDRVQELMRNGGALTESAAQAVYEARLDEIYSAIIAESARWGDNRVDGTPYTRQNWIDVNINDTTGDLKAVVPDFFPVRTGAVLGHFAGAGWLQSLAAPVFNNYGGEVVSGFDVTIIKPVGSPGAAEIYYTIDGTDPRLVGGAANPNALHSAGPITFDIDTTKQILARIKNGTEWSAVIDATFTVPVPSPVRITEVHYNPANHPSVADSQDLEFFELLNTGSQTISLEGVQIAQFATPGYTFGSGIDLEAGERIIVARTPSVFQSVYGTSINLAPVGFGTANLSNGGEPIALLGPSGETLQEFTYDDVAPWPASPDGGGPSLEIIDPLGDPTNPANWRASALSGGSPGTDGTPPSIPGDYDGNHAVEQEDFDLWKSTFGSSVTLGSDSDGNNDGIINAADYVVWRKFMGASPGAGGETTTQVLVSAPFSSVDPGEQPLGAAVTGSALEGAVKATSKNETVPTAATAGVSLVDASVMSTESKSRNASAAARVLRRHVAVVADDRLIEFLIRQTQVERTDSDFWARFDSVDADSPRRPSSRQDHNDLDAAIWDDPSWLNRGWWRLRVDR